MFSNMSDTIYTVNLRLPVVLAQKVKNIVEKRRESTLKFSMNDWLIEAVRGHLDGVPASGAVVRASSLQAPPPPPRAEDASPRERRSLPPSGPARNALPEPSKYWLLHYEVIRDRYPEDSDSQIEMRDKLLKDHDIHDMPIGHKYASPAVQIKWLNMNYPGGAPIVREDR